MPVSIRSTQDLLRDGGLDPAVDLGTTLSELILALEESRVRLLDALKEAGVVRLPERQKICNALSKAVREGRVHPTNTGGAEHGGEQTRDGQQKTGLHFRVYADMLTATALLHSLEADAAAARRALSGGCSTNRTPPSDATAVVVGCGIAGMRAAVELLHVPIPSREVVILEKEREVGGVWSLHANSYSRVNSSEPSYRVGAGTRTNHTPTHQMFESFKEFLCEHELTERVFASCDVISIRRQSSEGGARWEVDVRREWEGAEKPEGFRTTCDIAVLCTNRRLGAPRAVPYVGEESFAGAICRGLASDAERITWKGDALIVGMGAFGLEHFRTALERGASRATILCRRRGTVCPQVIDWVNYIRPVDADFNKRPSGSAQIQMAWAKTYQSSGAKPPECWKERPRLLKPDGHTVSTSDLFFVAHHTRVGATLLGEVGRVVSDGVITQDHGEAPGSKISCAVLIKCVGFELNATNEHILGKSEFSAIGVVDENLWYVAEPHIDAGAFSLPFGSSYLNQAQFQMKLMAHAFRTPSCAQALFRLPRDSNVTRYTSTEVFRAVTAAAHVDPSVGDMLRDHVAETTRAFHASMPFDIYLDRNEVMWVEYHLLIYEKQGVKHTHYLPWLFREFGKLIATETEAY